MKRRVLKKNFGVVAVIFLSMADHLLIFVGIMLPLLLFLGAMEMQSFTEKILFISFALLIVGLTVVICYYTYKTNRIEYGEGRVFTVKRVQFWDEKGNLTDKWIRLEEEFLAKDVVKIDYAKNFHKKVQWMEFHAYSTEVQFETKKGGVKKDMQILPPKDKYNLFQYIYNQSGTAPEREFCKKERIPLSIFGRSDLQVMKKYGYLYFSAYKKDCIEIGEGKLVSTVDGKRTELLVKDIKEMKFMEETEEVLFEMKDGRSVKVNLRFLKKKKDLFYYIYWRGGIRPNEDICRRFHLKLDEHEE